MTKLRSAVALLALVLFPLFVIALVGGATIGVVALVQGGHSGLPAIKFLLVPIVFAIYWAIKDLKRAPAQGPDGPALTRDEHPRLWSEIDRLAAMVHTRGPERVVLAPYVNAAVMEIDRRREMVIGLPLLASMTVGQVRSVLAHELGHFAGGDTAAAARARAWLVTLHRIRDNATGPMRWLLNAYVWFYTRVSAAASRDLERAADDFSARVAGPAVAASAMRRLAETTVAWTVLNDNYVALFRHAGARASLAQGLSHVLDANLPAIRATVDQELAGERRQANDTHPTTRERIATFETMPTAAPQLSGGDEPALALLSSPAWLLEAEGELFADDLAVVTWDEVVARAGAAAATASAAEITRHLEAQGAISGRHLGAALGLLDGDPVGRALGSWFAPQAQTAELARTNRDILGTLVVASLVQAGIARHATNWSGPWQIVREDGTLLDTESVVADALTDPDGATRLRAWLTTQGVDLDSDAGEPTPERARLLAVTTLMTGPWEGRRDGYFYSTGLLFLDPGDEAVSRIPGAQNQSRQRERVTDTASQGLERLRGLSGAQWFDRDEVTAARIAGLADPKVTLRLSNGSVVQMRGKSDSWSSEDAHAALRDIFADKLVDNV
ncbi:M48 family metallopeptidase [Intrasporangium sp.]|uniref:M48 family metallopeptidase n=1 Tax=Intrasporangium sp. TaxID=1925024 RepID=UPI0029398F59|nr:M48 family metallopeptidase [Intrasporangium sp.]MDV3222236.1 M48 family metallopeptidase [Intrasporangium sp.]